MNGNNWERNHFVGALSRGIDQFLLMSQKIPPKKLIQDNDETLSFLLFKFQRLRVVTTPVLPPGRGVPYADGNPLKSPDVEQKNVIEFDTKM